MKVTPFVTYDRILNGFQNSFQDIDAIYNRISTGKQYLSPSENVLGLSKAQDYKVSINSNTIYKSNIDSTNAQLGYTEGVLDSVSSTLVRLQELTLRASNGTETASSRQSIQEEVSNLRDFMMSIANSQYQGKYVFSGYKTDTMPYDPSDLTRTYQGDSGQKDVQVDSNNFIKANIAGDKIFEFATGAGTVNMFNMLDTLYNDLQTNNVAGIQNTITQLDGATTNISNVRADLGSRMNTLDKLNYKLDTDNVILKSDLSKVEDADFAQAVSDLARSQTALQAMRESASRVISQSLLDFLR